MSAGQQNPALPTQQGVLKETRVSRAETPPQAPSGAFVRCPQPFLHRARAAEPVRRPRTSGTPSPTHPGTFSAGGTRVNRPPPGPSAPVSTQWAVAAQRGEGPGREQLCRTRCQGPAPHRGRGFSIAGPGARMAASCRGDRRAWPPAAGSRAGGWRGGRPRAGRLRSPPREREAVDGSAERGPPGAGPRRGRGGGGGNVTRRRAGHCGSSRRAPESRSRWPRGRSGGSGSGSGAAAGPATDGAPYRRRRAYCRRRPRCESLLAFGAKGPPAVWGTGRGGGAVRGLPRPATPGPVRQQAQTAGVGWEGGEGLSTALP